VTALRVALDRPLPPALPAGGATALFVVGSCFAADAVIDRLEILVDGVASAVSAHGMPRPDVQAATGRRPGYLSGFWATVPVFARSAGSAIGITVSAMLHSGVIVEATLGTVVVVEPPPAPVPTPPTRMATPAPGTIAICMATFEPSLRLFRAQIESLRAQLDDRWTCLISDDCSSPERFADILAIVGEDARFAVSRSEMRLGFYRNFERALRMVPGEIELVALCDQDDRWHPDKLATLRAAIGADPGAILAYSDLRLVDAGGRVLRETFWRGRSNNSDNLASMVIANTITGAAMLFRRELIDIAVPFPDTPGFQFHDHWLAIAALSAGDIAYVDRPLYDYVQHAGAVFGDVTHGARRPELAGFAGLLARLRARPKTLGWRAGYFYGYLAREAAAQTALVRCADRLPARKRRALQRFIACDRSIAALLWLLARSLRRLAGRTETLGTELELAQGLAWKRLLTLRARHWRLLPGSRSDASMPPPDAFVQERLRRWRQQL
jgi:glycosyltransferase involved in cell wall biosynthesis